MKTDFLPWFDEKTGELLIDDYLSQMPSYLRYVEDGEVTEDEMNVQGALLIEKLRLLDSMIDGPAKAVATDVLCELAVYVALDRIRHLANALV